ncbi:MAG TPA: rhodanese-like domain-containing protein [Candidatus Methylomirabilis sp.]|nr:rhodanese-like domain-containing protein [Candidatus Methylomirabilis sp.]
MNIDRLVCVVVLWAVALGANPVTAVAGDAPARVPVPGGAYTNVTAPLLRQMLERKDFFFVNVHIPYEGEIAPTDAFIPYDQVEKLLHQFPTKKDAKILLYCQSGRMSDIAARTLVRLGYTNLWHLKGGMVGWRQQGYPLSDLPKK